MASPNKVLKFQSEGAVLVEISPLLISAPLNQNRFIEIVTLEHTHQHTHTHFLTHTCTHTCTHTHTVLKCSSGTVTQQHTHKHTHSISHTHTHTVLKCFNGTVTQQHTHKHTHSISHTHTHSVEVFQWHRDSLTADGFTRRWSGELVNSKTFPQGRLNPLLLPFANHTQI